MVVDREDVGGNGVGREVGEDGVGRTLATGFLRREEWWEVQGGRGGKGGGGVKRRGESRCGEATRKEADRGGREGSGVLV